MPNAVITVGDLLRDRVRKVPVMLHPLRRQTRVACTLVHGMHAGGRVVAAHDGSNAGDFHDWTFRTFAQDIRCHYHELWKPLDEKAAKWFLDRAYLNFLRVNRSTNGFDKFVSVHTDPNCTDAGPVRLCKAGPHLHVYDAENPIPDCHFPLTIGYLDSVLGSTTELMRVFGEAVETLSNEFLSRC